MNVHRASLFDLDHTLLNVNCSFQFGAYLYKRKKFSFLSMLFLIGYYGLHKIGQLSLQNLHEIIFSKLFKGTPFNEIKKNSIDFLNENFDQMLYAPALEKLNQAKKSGELTIILSSSPDFLVKIFADRLGVDQWIGTNYLLDQNQNFTAIEEVLDGNGKAKFLRNLSNKTGISIHQMTGYSDSILDLPFLKEVGKAVAVNPDSKLRAVCKTYQWDII